jgi:hypothetical protein
LNMPPLQQADGLLVAGVSVRVGAFGFRMVFVLKQNVSIRSDPRGDAAAVMACRRNAVGLA